MEARPFRFSAVTEVEESEDSDVMEEGEVSESELEFEPCSSSRDEVCFHGHAPLLACHIPKNQPVVTVGLKNESLNGIVGVLG